MKEKKKKPKKLAEFYLYSEGAQKRVQHQQQKQLEEMKNRSGGDPRYKTGTGRA